MIVTLDGKGGGDLPGTQVFFNGAFSGCHGHGQYRYNTGSSSRVAMAGNKQWQWIRIGDSGGKVPWRYPTNDTKESVLDL